MMAGNYFVELHKLDVNKYKEEKNGLTYLSWPYAWAEIKKRYPDAEYVIEKFDGLPYVFDEKTGYMVYTQVTIGGQTHEMWLPVMDANNKAMKDKPYTYTVRQFGKQVEKTCNAATMFDVNKAIMRCLVKNLAMHGLGLYIYAGEDLPETEKKEPAKEEPETISEQEYYDLEELIKAANCNKDKLLQQYGLESFILLDRPRYLKLKEKLEQAVKEKT